VLMAMRHFKQPYSFTATIEAINYVFALIFTVEAAIKLIALRWRYFDENWNRFDFIIVIFTDAGLLLKWTIGLNVSSLATILRILRVGRVFRLLNSAKELQKLFNALLLTVPSLGNISSLLMLMYFIFSVLGVQLFATVKFGENMNEQAHFHDFWTAMLVLMRSSTGEFWNGIMYDTANQLDCHDDMKYDARFCAYTSSEGPVCDARAAGVDREAWLTKCAADGMCAPLDGCGTDIAYPYFVAFTLLVTFVFVNLFIAVIIDGFNASQDNDEAEVVVGFTVAEYRDFCIKWQYEDSDMNWLISPAQLGHLFGTLPSPMGMGLTEDEYSAMADKIGPEISEHVAMVRVKRCTYAPEYYAFDAVAQALSKRVVLMAFDSDPNSRLEVSHPDALDAMIHNTEVAVKSANKIGKQLEKRMEQTSKRGVKKMTSKAKPGQVAPAPQSPHAWAEN